MLSRAFGDWELKSYGVISEPYITKININDYDKYLIIATDGIWDVLDDSDVYEMSKNINNSQELCNKIIEKALDKGSMDNISCFVINLN
jgi:protein phosphatase PTC1